MWWEQAVVWCEHAGEFTLHEDSCTSIREIVALGLLVLKKKLTPKFLNILNMYNLEPLLVHDFNFNLQHIKKLSYNFWLFWFSDFLEEDILNTHPISYFNVQNVSVHISISLFFSHSQALPLQYHLVLLKHCQLQGISSDNKQVHSLLLLIYHKCTWSSVYFFSLCPHRTPGISLQYWLINCQNVFHVNVKIHILGTIQYFDLKMGMSLNLTKYWILFTQGCFIVSLVEK